MRRRYILYSTYYDNRFRVVSCHMSMYMISICMHRVVQECILLCFFLELFRNGILLCILTASLKLQWAEGTLNLSECAKLGCQLL